MRCLSGFCSVGARHDSRVPSAHEREALALCDWSGGFWDLSCVPGTALPFTKKHRFLRMRTWHPVVKPSADTTEARKTARCWIEEQVRSRCRAERPARYSDTAAVEIPDWPLHICSIRRTN
ncbi:unnamed protein product, partial [Staurois parvus]